MLSGRVNLLDMTVFGFVALIGALTGAAVGDGPSVADSSLDKGVIELVHHSKRYGWHCGMSKSYDHEHKESCRRERGHWGDSEESRYGAWRPRFGAGGRPVEN